MPFDGKKSKLLLLDFTLSISRIEKLLSNYISKLIPNTYDTKTTPGTRYARVSMNMHERGSRPG